MKRAASFLITVYASVPVVLHLFPWILGHAIFAHLLRLPFFVDLDRPEDVLNHTCNFYLGTEEGVSVGVWHTLPASKWEEAAGKSPEWYRGTLGDGHPVVIYLHGNILSAAGYHVLSLDYRGSPVEAIILESPYTRIGEVVVIHPLAKMYMFLPGFDSLLWNILDKNRIEFPNDKKVQQNMTKYSYRSFCGARFNVSFSPTPPHSLKFLTCPLLILHAEDDNVVPHHMGLTLYQTSLQARKQHNTEDQVEMISYSANLGFSHSNIYLDPNLPNVVRGFLQKRRQ
ncbi:hypothetical protein F2P81_003107 [Scophthalmus maximus]|uniref:Monoacylglycerol lipase ABHD12-like n=1 Tax=Scophthalmus maximus TaxID=52904 RepID=A0A6A4TGJ6_SCOMX|nr:hypothetical protein F2P81_003107 [Scophthalmus maximus]